MPGKHIAVLYGGLSSERQVSLWSGEACANALSRIGYDVTRVDVDDNLIDVLRDLKPDVCFNALHGPEGEDGKVQALLEFLKIPYTHSGVAASAIAMNKQQSKIIAQHYGIPVAEAKYMDRHDFPQSHPIAPPYVVKPIAEGSSFGVIMVKEDQNHPPQIITSPEWAYGDQIMAERFVHGRELTCAVMDDQVLGVTEIFEQGSSFYDFDAKYKKGGSKHQCPAKILPNIYQKIETLALTAHRAIGCRGVSRSDFRFDDRFSEDGELIWLEINTQPGMTETSLVPELAQHAGYSFEDFVNWMVEDASCSR